MTTMATACYLLHRIEIVRRGAAGLALATRLEPRVKLH